MFPEQKCCWPLAFAVLALAPGCGEGPAAEAGATDPPAGRAPVPESVAGSETFTDRAREAGLDFSYWNGMTGRHYLLEVMGGGAALLDYDGDGDLDLYVVQGAALDDGLEPLEAAPEAAGDRLFRDDSAAGQFTDVTEAAGIEGHGYGMGVATGDFDNDGRIDLYVTNWGANQLLRNAAGGNTDVTLETGSGDDRWSVAATFFDYDRDGWLDLFAGNYVDFTLEGHKVCAGFGASEDYCGPAAYPAQADRLLHNLGPGPTGSVAFEDVTARAGLIDQVGPALGAFAVAEVSRGVAAGDVDNDGDADLVVVNSNGPLRLLINNASNDRHWLGLRLIGAAGRDMLGAVASLHRPGGAPLRRRVHTDGSYASAGDPRLLFGLGDSAEVTRLEVSWPDGSVEVFDAPPLDRYTTLRQGTGRPTVD